ncbi:ParA family protein [Mangrovihabitans endophyticus]|uniref:Chromosome partitioning ATPase n=1 Tax=Mangrovihabitans endophyticus TaxID=1751298 RepID=A0A8J3FSL4_9ACTN|nr:ParA family protein [Mangrovihabitans endophyticus]GGL17881.1 chromosome partitioning ATPase [Mangrovihabitans endophyticus]
MPYRVVIGNNKGGSGKTATTVNLAAALAEASHRVLVVDMDPQANASRRLGRPFDPAEPVATTAEVVKAGADQEGVAAAAVVACGWDGTYAEHIDLIPSRFDLENRVSEAGVLGAVGRLYTALSGVDDDYDVTLIDCPPSLGHLTQLGMAAATHALCTVEPEFDGVDGAVRFRDFIAKHGPSLRQPGAAAELRMAGFVVTRVRSQMTAHSYQIEGLPDLFGDLLWSPQIPERAAIKDAADIPTSLRTLGTGPAREMAAVFAELAKQLLAVQR